MRNIQKAQGVGENILRLLAGFREGGKREREGENKRRKEQVTLFELEYRKVGRFGSGTW